MKLRRVEPIIATPDDRAALKHCVHGSGDGPRQLNRALHTVALSRLTHHRGTRDYAAKRTAEGKTPRDIRRCLKRAIAREIFRLLEAQAKRQGQLPAA